MDPHSRLSQFNQRAPKSGPQALNVRFATDTVNISTPSSPLSSTKRPASHTSMALVGAAPTKKLKGQIRRPIATNSRIGQLQDDKMKKDMYLAFIMDALDKKSNGVTAPFDDLLDQFNPQKQASSSSNGTPPSTLRLWISSLSHVVSRLERAHSPLVHAIVYMPWTTFDQAAVKSYTTFIGMLVSARPEYLSMVLGMIAKGFTYQSGLKATHPSISSPSLPLTRRTVYDRLHFLLQHLLTLIPTLPSTLEPLLIANFPHKRQNQQAQVTYIRNLLRVSSYCPELASGILGCIVDRAIQIDVEIQVEIEELEAVSDDNDALNDPELFDLDPFDTLVGQEGSDLDTENEAGSDIDDGMSDLSSDAGSGFDDDEEDNGAGKELRTNSKYIQDMVHKLDAILELIFEYFKKEYEGSGEGSGENGDKENGLENGGVQQKGALEALPELPPIDSPSILTPTVLTSFYPFPANTSTSLQTPTLEFPPVSLLNSAATISSNPTSPNPRSNKRKRAFLLSQFHTLLSIFDRTILRTFKSRYTQFLVFWYTSLDREFSDIFQGMLVERALLESISPDEGAGIGGNGGGGLRMKTPTITRAAAASYIGSYVSRAEFVDGEETRAIMGVLCSFLGGHLDGVEDEMRAIGLGGGSGVVGSTSGNTVWYAVVQAVFLIFCFRWRDLLVDEDGDGLGDVDFDEVVGRKGGGGVSGARRWLPGLSVMQRVVQSVLNPLKICSPNVVMQFAKVAHATNFLYCYTILEANRRSDYAAQDQNTSSGSMVHSAVLGGAVNPELSTFFPFDPYRLPKSGSYIQGIYREWSSVALDNEEEDDSDEDGDDDEDGGEGDEERDEMKADLGGYLSGPRSSSPVMMMRLGGETDEDEEGLGESLDKMNISPVHPALCAKMAGA